MTLIHHAESEGNNGSNTYRAVSMLWRRLSAWLLVTILPFMHSTSYAQDLYWVCGDGFQWDSVPTSFCWSTTSGGPATVGQPVPGDSVFLIQSSVTDITVEYFDPAPANLTNLLIDATGAGMMTLSQATYSHALVTASETVGDSGTGQVILSNGTHTVTNTLNLGNTASGNGSFTTSNGASLTAGTFNVGNAGTGTLNIQSGSSVTNTDGVLGAIAGSDGTVTVDGAGSTWSNTGDLSVGGDLVAAGGTGNLTVQNGGAVDVAGTLTVWNTGTASLAGGSITTNTFDAAAGTFSFTDGSLTVDGGSYSDGNADLIINSLGANPTLVLTNGATAAPTGNTLIGDTGTGTLNIQSGSSVTNTDGVLGAIAGSDGTVTVDGAGSSWINSGILRVGDSGSGTLTVRNGGAVHNTSGYLGSGGNSDGTVIVTGPGSTWTNTDSLYVGGLETVAGGSSNLQILVGGSVDVTNTFKVWNTGSVELTAGTLSVGDLDVDGSFIFNSGSLNVANDFDVGFTGVLGSDLTLTAVKLMSVGGTTTIDPFSTLTLDSGTFSTGAIVNNGLFDFQRGTFNLTNDNLIIGSGGLLGGTLQLSSTQIINVTLDTVINSDGLLVVDNNGFNSTDYTNNGEILLTNPIARLKGGNLANDGLVRGEGRIEAVLTNLATGEIRAQAGDRLLFTGAGNSNAGEVNLLGGTAEFTQDLTNASGGVIAGRGTLIANGGITNQGNIALSSSTTDIFGDVNNATGGSIIVSGNGTATFYDDVVHNGTEIRVSGGSSAVFFGAVSGAGSYTGIGSLFFEGDLNPGNSPALVNMGGDMSLGINSHTIMEITGLGRGTEYDAFNVGGDLWLGGVLDISLYDLGSGLFDPQLGDSFDLFMADTISGNFDLLTLAALSADLGWQLDVLTDTIGLTDVVRLSVVISAVPVPPSVWLFGSGLLGLVGIARRRRAA